MLDVKELAKELEKYKQATEKEVKEIVFYHGSDLLHKAQRNLIDYVKSRLGKVSKKDMETLNSINLTMYSEIGSKGFSVAVGVPTVDAGKKSRMAAYIEFGTGKSAREILAPYPKEIQELARKYFETGRGTLKGSPYLFNNYLLIRDNFIKELNAYLETRNK